MRRSTVLSLTPQLVFSDLTDLDGFCDVAAFKIFGQSFFQMFAEAVWGRRPEIDAQSTLLSGWPDDWKKIAQIFEREAEKSQWTQKSISKYQKLTL